MSGVYRNTGKGPYRTEAGVYKAGIAIQFGDLTFRDTDGYDKGADQFTWTTDLATTQAAFAAKFRGVSAARRLAAQTSDGGRSSGMLIVTGEFAYPCAALGSAAKPGDLFAIAQGTGNTLDPQKVVGGASSTTAIFKITEDAPVGATEVKVRFYNATL